MEPSSIRITILGRKKQNKKYLAKITVNQKLCSHWMQAEQLIPSPSSLYLASEFALPSFSPTLELAPQTLVI